VAGGHTYPPDAGAVIVTVSVGDSKEVMYPLLPGVVFTGIAVTAVPAMPLQCSRRMVPVEAQGTAWAGRVRG
jgi:hypothetical protein